MRINTRTGKIELTKRELQVIKDAGSLLSALEKHGTGVLADDAKAASAALIEVRLALDGVAAEVEHVGK